MCDWNDGHGDDSAGGGVMGRPGTFVKGEKRPNQGKRGPNKTTVAAREAIAVFIDGNSDRLQGWLDQIAAEKGPEAAFKCFSDLLEYHVPKLARTEMVGADGGAIKIGVELSDAELLAVISGALIKK